MRLSGEERERLPTWLLHPYLAASDVRLESNPATRLKPTLDLAEAWLEYSCVMLVSAFLGRRERMSVEARGTIEKALGPMLKKLIAMGDWVRLFQAFTRADGLATDLLGFDVLAPLRGDHPALSAVHALRGGAKQSVTLAEFFDAVCSQRNKFSHHQVLASEAASIGSSTLEALTRLLQEATGFATRPLCVVEQNSRVKAGFELQYRALVGSFPQPDKAAMGSQDLGCQGDLVFWDRAAGDAFPAPQWLAWYREGEPGGTLWFFQGRMDPRWTLQYHSRQPVPDGKNVVLMSDFHALLRQDLGALIPEDGPSRDRPDAGADVPARGARYEAMVRSALSNDGVISGDERALLAMALSLEALTEDEARVIEERVRTEAGIVERPAIEAPAPPFDDGDFRDIDARPMPQVRPAATEYLETLPAGKALLVRRFLRCLQAFHLPPVKVEMTASKRVQYLYVNSPWNVEGAAWRVYLGPRDDGFYVAVEGTPEDPLPGEPSAYWERMKATGLKDARLAVDGLGSKINVMLPGDAGRTGIEAIGNYARWYLFSSPLLEVQGPQVTKGAEEFLSTWPGWLQDSTRSLLAELSFLVRVRLGLRSKDHLHLGSPYDGTADAMGYLAWLWPRDEGLQVNFNADPDEFVVPTRRTYRDEFQRLGAPNLTIGRSGNEACLQSFLPRDSPPADREGLVRSLRWFLTEAPAT